MTRKYGWSGPRPTNWTTPTYKLALPTKVDHVDQQTLTIPILDQGDEGACTGFGSSRVVQGVLKSGPLSAQFAYFNARVPEATQDVDAGASVGDAMAGIIEYGLAQESVYPYIAGQFAQRPTLDAYADGMAIKGKVKYQRISGSVQFKHALVSGFLVVLGFSVPDYFESDEMATTGWLRLPTAQDQFIGGHCVAADGYDTRLLDEPEAFAWIPNSWGKDWGLNGYFKMPLRWLDDHRRLVDDMYVVMPT